MTLDNAVRWKVSVTTPQEITMTQPDEDLDPGTHLAPEERDLEAPDGDVVEQATTANPAEEPSGDDAPSARFDVNEWDALEQAKVVELDDDYR
jgi:hypothetical protein